MPCSIFRIAALAPVITAGALALSLPAAAATPARTVPQAPPTWGLCAAAVSAKETQHKIPSRLLTAISLVESGRWNPRAQRSMAWPWTVHAQGKGRFFPSKRAAIAAVRALQKRGVRSIDVGCMQVNLRYHPEAFADLETAFDPASNVDYAADLLKRLRQEARSWTKAIAFYHSRTPKFNGPYRLKVFRAWREERHRANRATAALTP